MFKLRVRVQGLYMDFDRSYLYLGLLHSEFLLMKQIPDISAEEWNKLRTKLNTLKNEVLELNAMLPRALDRNFVEKQIELKQKEIKELTQKTEPKL